MTGGLGKKCHLGKKAKEKGVHWELFNQKKKKKGVT